MSSLPKWVKVSLIIVALVLLMIVISAAFGIEHGPGQHGAPAQLVQALSS